MKFSFLRRFDGAVKKISEKYDEIERSLIDEFVSAQRMNNIERMKQIALILYNFKGYSQCVNAFIEQSQVVSYSYLIKSLIITKA